MDLNMMMREQATAGLKRELDEAVTNGDTAAATKAAEKLAALAVDAAPPKPAYGPNEIKAELGKVDWFGVDPEKTTYVLERGKNLDIKKFATAADFAKALVDAALKQYPDAAAAGAGDGDGDGEGAGGGDGDGEGEPAPAPKPKRKTDGPGDGDATQRSNARGRSSGPWTKLSDAPGDVQKEINRTADKFAGTDKKKRDAFIEKALEGHYAAHQRKGKK